MTELPVMWRQFVETLQKLSKADENSECVICQRAELQPLIPHPTKKCGFLWTMTPAGLKWLRDRRKAKAAAREEERLPAARSAATALVQAQVNEADIDACLAAYACGDCGDDYTTIAFANVTTKMLMQ
jgi:hypothetical protein